jgi:hypothetical protein
MVTQFPPRQVPSPGSSVVSNPASQSHPASVQGSAPADGVTRKSDAHGDSVSESSSKANGATGLVQRGKLRADGAATDGEIKTDEDTALMRLPAPIERLPVGLLVSVPVRDFRVRNLLAMALDELIETQWGHGEDLPLSSGDVQVAWSEFEVLDARLAVRVTRLA